MPGLLQRSNQLSNGGLAAGSLSSSGIWSKHNDNITFDQLQKFWSELPLQARQELLRIDKQTLIEQARRNLYCSRCNGLLLQGFSQIVMYGKSLQLEGSGTHNPNRIVHSKAESDSEPDDVQNPSVDPWGGLATTRDAVLTLLDCFINAKSLKALQNVFDNARARERERELLYPDACGGGGRGWISQGMSIYGRGHGIRDTCALHTARLSCDTLVDFWSALSDETRSSLLRMREEDFMERLMYRFDSKRFCRDCRRNVIREFKELKELKRMRKEPCCSSWFCVADPAFKYEVSEDTVQADWHQSFTDSAGTYHRFEWGIGTGEGKSDILDFEDVGMNGKVHVNGLNLGGLTACFITVRAWKLDGRCTELCVKAHALKGQPCVHRRLIVGDGFVTMTKGESIRSFFEHAEEAEEEEDDDAMDNDGNEYDGDCSRPQKHAKSPELAREFLLDAATVIFKEQVEKAFREGTARQNAHSIFVCLALKLLEERIHVACKEIITLEKQKKLLEEEEKEKREEEERKERRRTKGREKKDRRKERLKGKERESDIKHTELDNNSSSSTHGDSVSESGDVLGPGNPNSTNQEQPLDNGCLDSKKLTDGILPRQCYVDGELSFRDDHGSFTLEQSKSSRRRSRYKKDFPHQASNWLFNGAHRSSRERVSKTNARKFNCYYNPAIRSARETKPTDKTESSPNGPRPLFRRCYVPDSSALPKGRDVIHTKQVWEPTDARKKWVRSNSDRDLTTRTAVMPDPSEEIGSDRDEHQCELPHSNLDESKSSDKSDPMRRSSSSDNCSSCLSEENSQNAGSSSTSDSEDASQHSDGRYVPMEELARSDTAPPPPHTVPMHHKTMHVPAMAYHNQCAPSWAATPASEPQHSQYMFPGPFGYGLMTNQSPHFQMPHKTIQQPSLYRAQPPSKPPSAVQNGVAVNAAKPKGEISSFSLFHFGGPVAGAAGYSVSPESLRKENNIPSLPEETTMEEYSLFSGSRYIFF